MNEFISKELATQVTVDKIVSEANEEDNKRKHTWILKYGKKSLELSFSKKTNAFATYVYNIDSEDKKENETTLLYLAAKKIMKKKALEKGPLQHRLQTKFKSIALWSYTTGDKIFNWDNIHGPSQIELERWPESELNTTLLFDSIINN